MASSTINYFRAAIVYVLLMRTSGECYDSSVGLGDVGKVNNGQMSASSEFNVTTPAANGRLNYTSGSSWCASSRDSAAYLQVDLGSVYIICGVATQGNSQADQWVRTYQVQYSTNETTWIIYQENGTFEGNFDRNTIVRRVLYEGFEARYVRVLPNTFYGGICLRLELYGITTQSCQTNAIGLSSTTTFPNHRFSASTSFDARYQPYEARFNTSWYGWAPSGADRSTCWLRIDIGSVYILCAISTLGNRYANIREYVKKYKLKFTLNNKSWSSYMETGQEKVFEGNTAPRTEKKNVLSQAVRAKIIEIVPTDFNSYPTLRVELFGVVQPCASSLGIENGDIKDSQITASSGSVSNCRLYNTGGSWCSSTQSNTEYIQVDLGKPGTVRGVATQGSANQNYWTKSFSVAFSYDNVAWYNFTENGVALKVFSTANNQHTVRTNWFHNPLVARYVRIYPQTWNGRPCVRFDLYGCSDVLENFPKVIVAAKNVGYTQDGNAIVELECHTRGQPEPLVQWRQGTSDVSKNVTVAKNLDGSIVIRLRKVVLSKNCWKTSTSSRAVMCNLPTHVCVASYQLQYGDIRPTLSNISLVKLDAPDAMKGLRVSESNARSVKIVWTTPDPGSTFIVAYRLQFDGKFVNISSDVTYYLLEALDPYRRYTMSITAVNTLGDGLWARLNFTTAQAAPSKPDNLKVVVNPNVPRVSISWSKPKTPNGVIKHYRVYWRLLTTGTEKTVKVNAKDTNYTLNVVGGLTYEFGVSATTVEEGTKATKTQTIRNYEPSKSPEKVTAFETGAGNMVVTWSPVSGPYRNGEITHYTVYYRIIFGDKVSCTEQSLRLNASVTRVQVSRLEKYVTYTVSVSANTSIGEGPRSNGVLVTMAAAKPGKAPENVTVFKTHAGSMVITWKPAALLDQNVIITGYTVYYHSISVSTLYYKEQFLRVNASVTRVQLSNLEEYVIFVVSVSANTSIGEGPRSKEVLVKTAIASTAFQNGSQMDGKTGYLAATGVSVAVNIVLIIITGVLLWKLRRQNNGCPNFKSEEHDQQKMASQPLQSRRRGFIATREPGAVIKANSENLNDKAVYANPIPIQQEYMELQPTSDAAGKYESLSQNARERKRPLPVPPGPASSLV